MREVSKEEFFRRIFADGLDVHPTITNAKYPYSLDWRFHRQLGAPLFGRSVDTESGATKYYLADTTSRVSSDLHGAKE